MHAFWFDNVRIIYMLWAGEHEILWRVGIQWTRTGEDQRQASHGWLRCCDGGGAIRGPGRVCSDIQRRDSMVRRNYRCAITCVSDSSVQRGERGVQVRRVYDFRGWDVEWEVCNVRLGCTRLHRVCQGWNPCVDYTLIDFATYYKLENRWIKQCVVVPCNSEAN